MSTVIEMPEVFQVTVSNGTDGNFRQISPPVSVASSIDDLFADSTPPMPEAQPEPVTEPERENQPEQLEQEEQPEPNLKPAQPAQPAQNGLAPATLLEEIREQNNYIRYCEGEIEHCKGELKQAKENFDQALSRLRVLCEKLTKPLGEQATVQGIESASQVTQKSQPLEEEPVYAETFGEEQFCQGDGQEKTLATSRPIRIRIVRDVLENPEDDQSPILAKVGEVHDVMKVETESLVDGGVILEDEVYIHLGETAICLEPEEFEVIEWEEVSAAAEEHLETEAAPQQATPAAEEETLPGVELCGFLGISENQAAKFVKAGIRTVAELKAKMAAGFDLTTVPGVGKAKAEKFAEIVADDS